jgi:hypothetical protein
MYMHTGDSPHRPIIDHMSHAFMLTVCSLQIAAVNPVWKTDYLELGVCEVPVPKKMQRPILPQAFQLIIH